MKNKLFNSGVILFLLIIIFLGLQLILTEKSQPEAEVNMKGRVFKAELASSERDRAKGLSGRDSLALDSVMLFIFDGKSRRSFWMKDMKFNLDIIWLDDEEIVHIARNVSYEWGAKKSINPPVMANRVIEANAGLCDELGLQIGDRVEIKI